jgi:hypothetical protein
MLKMSEEMQFYRDQYAKQKDIIHKLQKEIDFKSGNLNEMSNITDKLTVKGNLKFGTGDEGFLPEELDFWNTKAVDE